MGVRVYGTGITRLQHSLPRVPVKMAQNAEAKISGVLHMELDKVEKECMRPLQVRLWTLKKFVCFCKLL